LSGEFFPPKTNGTRQGKGRPPWLYRELTKGSPMTPERWQQIDALLEAVLERAPAERATFLAQACGGDEELRCEVESLLIASEQAQSFIEAPPAAAAGLLAAAHVSTLAGRTLGHYQLRSLLGVGGMGEVYLAHDSQLRRQVALKLLPGEFTRDRERIQRFKQEARAVSSLNHPNIVTVYEIGQSEGLHFIATEFIDGQTLRQRTSAAPLNLSEALEIASQTAQALTAAHEAGIVHRDIKPENIMLRRDGFVKVLDFGLAKLLAPFRAEATTISDNRPSAEKQLSTDPGKVVGTPRYMSPEQICAQPVDARSDIFSLGVVLYEMIAGRAPFEGATPSEVIAAILHVEPLPLARFTPAVPPELERIVKKALRKERDERYQVVKELLLDLKSCKEELAFEARLLSARRSADHAETLTESSSGQAAEQPTALLGTTTRSVSSAEYLVGAISRHKRRAALALVAFVVIVMGLAFVWSRWGAKRDPVVPFRMDKLTRLTTTGKAGRVALAHDGKEVVYSVVEAGQQSLWLRQVDTGSEIQILPPDKVDYTSLSFARNGAFIYYIRREQNAGHLYQATKLGGSSRRLLSNVDSPITLSPDGQQIAFVRRNSSAGEYVLMIAQADGSGERRLAVRKHPDIFRLNGPSWSPNGKMIACGVEGLTGTALQTVIGVRVADGAEEALTAHRWENVGQVAWLADGSGLLVAATEAQGSLPQVWSLAWPSGETRRITRDLSAYANLSLSADGATLATVQRTQAVYIWVAPAGDASRAVPVTSGVQRDDGIRGLAWTPDGRIVYRSSAGGNPNIWIMAANGAGNRQLSADAHQNLDPTVAPDGSTIAWTSSRTGTRNIWQMNLDGSNLQQLTRGAGEWFPQFTPDGRWLIYQALATGEQDRLLWKLPLDGGAAVQLTNRPSYAPVVSPEGQRIACNYRPEAGAPIRIAVLSVADGRPLQTFALPGVQDRPLRWTPEGRALVYIETREGVSNLWRQPLAGGAPQPLTAFQTQEIFNFAWSRDGQQLALSRGVTNSDVVLLSALK
jgi:serine/threonine protein kinase/Tol biopolymer transport system component